MASTDYLLQALHITDPNPLAEQIAGDPNAGALWNQLNQWIGNLPTATRTKVMSAIEKWGTQQATSGLINTFGVGPGGLTLPQIQALATSLQGTYGTTATPVPGAQAAPKTTPATPAEQQVAAANQVQSQATSAATTATAQLPDLTSGEQGAGIPVVGSSGSSIPGTSTPADFNSMLQNYYGTEFAQAGSDPTALARLAGTTPQLLQQQYAAYQQGWNKAQTQFRPGIVGGVEGGQQPMSLQEFAQNKAQSMVGPWAAVLDAISGIYQSQFETPLPADLAAQIITALNGMPQAQQSNVLYNAYQYMTNKASATANRGLFDQTGSYAGALLGALPSSILTYTAGSGTSTGSLGTGGIVGTYTQAHPSAFLQGETITTEIAQDFQQKLNRAPTNADLAALGSDPTPQQITTYIDNQPVPGTNMKYGAYSSAVSSLTSLWQQYFGKDPTTTELQWSIGQTPQDIQNFIYNSPSKVSGLTIGKYQDYSNEIQNVQGDLPVSASDDFMSSLHAAVTKK